MWILHPRGGFLSAVQHNDNDELLVVRARVKEDLAELALWTNEKVTGGKQNTDYPWRIIVERSDFSAYAASLVLDIDYGNFKSEVAFNDLGFDGKKRARVYSRVWSDLLELEDLDPNGRPPVRDWRRA